jgi:hypothetical protein
VVLPTTQGRSSLTFHSLRTSPPLCWLLWNLLPRASSDALTEVMASLCTTKCRATAGSVCLLSETTTLSELLVLVCHLTVLAWAAPGLWVHLRSRVASRPSGDLPWSFPVPTGVPYRNSFGPRLTDSFPQVTMPARCFSIRISQRRRFQHRRPPVCPDSFRP